MCNPPPPTPFQKNSHTIEKTTNKQNISNSKKIHLTPENNTEIKGNKDSVVDSVDALEQTKSFFFFKVDTCQDIVSTPLSPCFLPHSGNFRIKDFRCLALSIM